MSQFDMNGIVGSVGIITKSPIVTKDKGEFIGDIQTAVQDIQGQQIRFNGKGTKPLPKLKNPNPTIVTKDNIDSIIDNTTVDDSIALREYDSIFQALKSRAIKVSLNNSKFAMGISTIGFVGGLGYAYKKGSGFWGYVGWSFLGSILGGIAGGGIDKVATDTKSDSNKIITTELRIQANALLGKTKNSTNTLISKKYFDLKSLMNTLDND